MLLNESFESEGAFPGEAEHWTLTTHASLEEIADFGPNRRDAWESFEGWSVHAATLGDVVVARAFFDGLADGIEDFGNAWDNSVFLLALPTGQLATCPFGGAEVEDGESGWNNTPYLLDWSDVASATGSFDGEPREDFEDQWRSNESYAATWSALTSSAASFDGGAQAVEDFENAWAHAVTL